MPRSHRNGYIALGLALALAIPAFGQKADDLQQWHYQNQEAGKQDQEQATGQAAVETPSALAPIPSAELSGADHDDNGKDTEGSEPQQSLPKWIAWDWMAWVSQRDSLAQWIMAVAGVIAIGISIWAVFLLRQTLRATRDAVDEGRNATRAAERAIEVTSTNAQIELRAYVFVSEAILKIRAGFSIEAIITLQNTGQTPAKDFSVWANITIQNHPFSGALVAIPPHKSELSRSPILPGSTSNISQTALIHMEEQEAVHHEKKAVYVVGGAKYTDVFGNNQTTNFRMFYSGAWNHGTYTLSVAPEGNDAT